MERGNYRNSPLVEPEVFLNSSSVRSVARSASNGHLEPDEEFRKSSECGPGSITTLPRPVRAFLHRPQSLLIRRAVFQVHLWIGITTGAYIVVVSLTGALLMWRIDLQRLAYPLLFTPSQTGVTVDADVVLESVRHAYPRHQVSGVDAPTTSRPTYLAYATHDGSFATILVDPATGRVLGELPASGPVEALQNLHFELLGGHTGRIVNGIGALCLLTMCASGLVIWWPGLQRWPRSFLIDTSRSWRRVIWDAHSAIGIWAVMFIAMWAATGAAFAFPSSFRALVGQLSPVTNVRPPTSITPCASASPPSWADLLAIARRSMPGQHVARVVIPSSESDAFLVMFTAVVPTPAGGADLTSVYVDRCTGAILREPPRTRRTLGDVVMAWTAPLHVGNFAGTATKIVWTVFGLAPGVLFATGVVMWWNRATKRNGDS